MVSTRTFLALCAATLASAVPCPKGPVLPLTGGATELPAAPAGTALKYIAVGHGIQNYTCAAAGETAVATGALAVLYQATNLYPGSGSAALPSLQVFESIPRNALYTKAVPINFDPSTEGRLVPDHLGASLTNPFPAPAPLELAGIEKPLPFLGHHFFDNTGAPRFVIGEKLFHGKVLNKVPAPASASPGPDGQAAVAWLQLDDKEGKSKGFSYVYRVITVGGSPHACTAAGADSVPYATYYWFFGPK